MNEVATIISQLEQQRAAIDQAISALRGINVAATRGRPRKIDAEPPAPKTRRRKRRMSEEGRARIAEAAKRMWAAKRAAGTTKKKAKRTYTKKAA